MSELNGLIARGLARMTESHVHELGRVLEAALSAIHPNERSSGRKSLDIFILKSVETMDAFLQSTREFVLTTIKSTNTVLTLVKVDELVSRPCKTPQPRMNASFFHIFGTPNPPRNVMLRVTF